MLTKVHVREAHGEESRPNEADEPARGYPHAQPCVDIDVTSISVLISMIAQLAPHGCIKRKTLVSPNLILMEFVY